MEPVKNNPTETPQQKKRKEMLASGLWKEGNSGELIRVRNVGLPSKDRLSYLEGLDRPLSESEAREYASASFDPSSNMNILFGLAAGMGFDPVGEAAMGLVGSGAKAVGRGVRAMKATTPAPTPSPSRVASPVLGGDPERAAEIGTEFVRNFYSDPYIQRHFNNVYGSYDLAGAVPKTFERGSNAPVPQPLDLKGEAGLDVDGAYFPSRDKAFISDVFYSDWARGSQPNLNKKVSSISAHEMTHYADSPIFSSKSNDWGVSDEMSSAFDRVSNATPTDKMSTYYKSAGATDNEIKEYWDYVSDPMEMAANAMSARQSMEDVIFSGKYPGLFSSIGDDKSFSKIMVGDFSGLSDLEFKMLMSEVYNNSDEHVMATLRHVLKGANDRSTYDYTSGKIWNDPEKKKSISDWLKYALMVPVAGAAATQAEMIDGGKLRILKKK